ncbi:hypothetical protein ACROYT_G007244 [Oculina patagonica]
MSYAGESRSGDSLDVLLVANKRKPNFTEGESLYLITQFERNSGVLTSKLNDASTNKQKVEVWKRICSDYNSRNPIVLRTANDLKRKWKNMVRAAKKELLEATAHSESGDQTLAPRKLSQVSQRIIEILRITVANCGFSSPGEAAAGINFDDNFADDQTEQTFSEEGGEENGERETNGEQQVVHVVVKPDVKPSIVSPAVNTEQSVGDSQQNANRESSLTALNSQTPSAGDQEKTQAEVPGTSSGQTARSAIPMTVVSSMSEVRQLPRVISTSGTSGGGGRHRFVVPQHTGKRLLSSPITHVIKKRRCADYGADETFSSHVRAEIEKLKKEKLMLEKEKLALEKEKLVMEKEKLALEIQFLRDQMD